MKKFVPVNNFTNTKPIILGWTGTFSSKEYLRLLEPILEKLSARRKFKLRIIGNFEYIQLHGAETSERVNEIKSMGLKIIKAIKIKDETDIKCYKQYENADIILFDTPGMEKSIQFPEDLISKLLGIKSLL